MATPSRISVNSLVNEDALPEWLRNAANSGALPPPMSYGGAVQSTGGLAGSGREFAPPGMGQTAMPSPGAQGSGQLRYGQPPAARSPMPPSPVGSGSLGANHLFDESALPDWLRTGAMGQSPDLPTESLQVPYNPSNPSSREDPRASSASAFPSIERAGSFQVPTASESGVSAPSLIDSNALPRWLSGKPETAAQSSYGRDAARGIPANSLVDENALPPWLRNSQPAEQSQHASGLWNGQQPGNQSLPAWLSQGYAETQTPRMDSSLEQSSAWNSRSAGGAAGSPSMTPSGHPPGTIAAGEFIDESALPEWLRSQGGLAGIPGAASPSGQFVAPPVAQPGLAGLAGSRASSSGNMAWTPDTASLLADGGAPATFSASDLIDPSALPEWVRGSDAGPVASFSSTSGWTSRQPVPPANQPTANGSFSSGNAESTNASHGAPIPSSQLPPWLTNDLSPAPGRHNPPAQQPSNPAAWSASTGDMNYVNSPKSRNMGYSDGPYDAYEAYPESADDGGFDDDYDSSDEYDHYTDYEDIRQEVQETSQPERRGWRRLFGRK
ncbi:MAG: hypothetical protein ACLQUY_15530 [Ktedonobacterales bacterium]